MRVADDEGVWCFAVTQLRALRVTCGGPWDARMCGRVGAVRGVPLQIPPCSNAAHPLGDDKILPVVVHKLDNQERKMMVSDSPGQ